MARQGELSRPRYERNVYGGTDYVLDIEMCDYLPHQISVTLTDLVATVQAECAELAPDGTTIRRDFRREVQLSRNVHASLLKSRYLANGTLELRAPVMESVTYCEPAAAPRPSRINYESSRSTSRLNGHNGYNAKPFSTYVSSEYYLPSRAQSATGFRSASQAGHSPVRIVYDLEPQQSTNSNGLTTGRMLTPRTITTMTNSSLMPVYTRSSLMTESVNNSYLHSIEIDPIFGPEHLSITVEQGKANINARVDRDPNYYYTSSSENWAHREFSCEHTLPKNVDGSRLTAELQPGLIILRAPYKSVQTSPRTRIVYEVPLRSSSEYYFNVSRSRSPLYRP